MPAAVQRLDTTAEGATLAAALTDAAFRAEVMAEPDDLFGHPPYRALWAAVAAVWNRGEPVDAVTVAAEASARGLGNAAGLLAGLPVPSTRYLPLLHRARMNRIAIQVAKALTSGTGDPGDRLAEAADTALAALGSHTATSVSAELAGRQALLSAKKGPAAWLRSGLPDLDAALRVLGPGHLLVIGGRPGDGKSALAAQIAAATAETRRGVALVSLEMSAQAVALRLLAQRARVDHTRLLDHALGESDMALVDAAVSGMAGWPLALVDQPDLTPGQLRGVVARERRARGCDVLIVDYLQVVSAPAHLGLRSDYDRVTYVSKALQALARDTGILVVGCAQLRRPERGAEGARPTLEDLRNSGALEQDADAVLLLHHDRPGHVELGLAKHRHGRTGALNARWVASQVRFAPEIS